MEVILREHLQFHYNKKMERLLIRVPLLLVEWLNPVGSGAMFLLYHKKPPRSWVGFLFLFGYILWKPNIPPLYHTLEIIIVCCPSLPRGVIRIERPGL